MIGASVLAMLVLIGGIAALTRSGQSASQATRRVAATATTPSESGPQSPAVTDQATPSPIPPDPSATTAPPAPAPTPSSHSTTARPPASATTPTCQPKGDIQLTNAIGLDGNTTAHVDLDGPPSQRS